MAVEASNLWKSKASQFLQEAKHFQLGILPTEQPHPLTRGLSHLSKENLKDAYQVLKEVDLKALQTLVEQKNRIFELSQRIKETLDRGNKIFFCGCGATGRLSISIEFFWKTLVPQADPKHDSVISFMAGGDLALVHSIENFEDRPDYGAKQLLDLGFKNGDLLVASTEGGETPFVIGAAECAAQNSTEKPWFLYCNPDDVLQNIQRSQSVIQNKNIQKINLFCGNMALTGSTRMQASTILMLGAGLPLLLYLEKNQDINSLENSIHHFIKKFANTDFSVLAPLTKQEADAYLKGEKILYHTDEYAITVFTDTTERSPTFSLLSFENNQDRNREPSMCYVMINQTEDSLSAWKALLGHAPRALAWADIESIAGYQRLLGFDFSSVGEKQRLERISLHKNHHFCVKREHDNLVLQMNDDTARLSIEGLSLIYQHTLLKCALNMHSTLLMGRLGRYEDNVMTFVKPSNKKLIDRAARYVQQLLEKNSSRVPYEQVVEEIFKEAEHLQPNEPIVVKVAKNLQK